MKFELTRKLNNIWRCLLMFRVLCLGHRRDSQPTSRNVHFYEFNIQTQRIFPGFYHAGWLAKSNCIYILGSHIESIWYIIWKCLRCILNLYSGWNQDWRPMFFFVHRHKDGRCIERNRSCTLTRSNRHPAPHPEPAMFVDLQIIYSFFSTNASRLNAQNIIGTFFWEHRFCNIVVDFLCRKDNVEGRNPDKALDPWHRQAGESDHGWLNSNVNNHVDRKGCVGLDVRRCKRGPKTTQGLTHLRVHS